MATFTIVKEGTTDVMTSFIVITTLGRDGLAQFRSFKSSTECATSHYIHTASDTIGPRGDEKRLHIVP